MRDEPTIKFRVVGTADGGGRWRTWSDPLGTSPARSVEGELTPEQLGHYVSFLERRGLWRLTSTPPAELGLDTFRVHVEDDKRRLDAEIGGAIFDESPSRAAKYKIFRDCFSQTLYVPAGGDNYWMQPRPRPCTPPPTASPCRKPGSGGRP